jgi:DNA-binding NarL/FixJ family response regulator
MNKIRIFVVDDHPALRHGIIQLLEKEPDFMVCGEAGNLNEAELLLPEIQADFAILDIALQESETAGLDFITRLHEIAGHIPVLIYSTYDEQVYAEKALRFGACGYLMKQEPVYELVCAIRTILREGLYVSRDVSNKLLLKHVTGESEPLEKTPYTLLSERERAILSLLGKGLRPREIAGQLCLSVKTVETHRRNIRQKLGLETAADLTRYAVEWLHGK